MQDKWISCDRGFYMEEGSHNMAIVIDGIIGAGKSTVGRFLSEYYKIPLFEELKDDGRESMAQRMLDRFYADQNRWSAIIQVMFLNDRFRDIKAVDKKGQPAIFDRSIYGDEVFARTIHTRGQMTADEFAIYHELLHNMLKHIKKPELLIYLDVTVDTAMDRINKRARSTEADLIPRDYMEDLRKHYEMWYESFDLCPKVRIDLNKYAIDDLGNLSNPLRDQVIAIVDPYLRKEGK